MDIYGVIITIITAVGTCVSTISAYIFPETSTLIVGITGAVVTCASTICEIIRKYKLGDKTDVGTALRNKKL